LLNGESLQTEILNICFDVKNFKNSLNVYVPRPRWPQCCE